MDADVLREILRQAREAANEGNAQLQAEFRNALGQLQGQVQQIRQQQLHAANGADPGDDLRARLDALERQLRPDPGAAPGPADGGQPPGVLFAGRPAPQLEMVDYWQVDQAEDMDYVQDKLAMSNYKRLRALQAPTVWTNGVTSASS